GPVLIKQNNISVNVTHLGVAGGITLPNDITIEQGNPALGNGVIQYLTATTGSSTLTGSITVQADNFTGGTFAGPTAAGDVLNINGPVNATGTATTISVRAGNVRLGGGGSYPEFDFYANALLNAPNGIATNALINFFGGTPDLRGNN